MNAEYNCKVTSKHSKRLLKNLQNTTGDYFFLPHPVVYVTVRINCQIHKYCECLKLVKVHFLYVTIVNSLVPCM